MSGNFNYKELMSEAECLQVIKNVMDVESELDLTTNDFQYDILPLSNEVMGYLGEYYNLRINIIKKNLAKENSFEFFIKALPVTNELNRNLIEKLKIFPKEARLYTELFKEMGQHTPSNWHCKCFYARSDLLVFENLKLLGFRNVQNHEKFTDHHIQETLKRMAQMHCSSFVLELKDGFNIGDKYESSLLEISLTDASGWFRAGLMGIHAVAELIPKYQNKSVTKMLPDPNNYNELYAFSDRSTKYRNTFCHRDIWSQNILFKYDDDNVPKEAILVDFQNCIYSPPATDFMMFIIQNLSTEERRNKFDWCTKFYYENLKNNLKCCDIPIESCLTYDEFLDSCDFLQILPLIFKGIYLPFTNSPDRDFFAKLKKSDPAKYDGYLEEDRTECILQFVNENEHFRNIMFEAVEDIIEYYVKHQSNASL